MEDFFAVVNVINNVDDLDPRRRYHIRDNAFALPHKKFVKLFRLNKDVTRSLVERMAEILP